MFKLLGNVLLRCLIVNDCSFCEICVYDDNCMEFVLLIIEVNGSWFNEICCDIILVIHGDLSRWKMFLINCGYFILLTVVTRGNKIVALLSELRLIV